MITIKTEYSGEVQGTYPDLKSALQDREKWNWKLADTTDKIKREKEFYFDTPNSWKLFEIKGIGYSKNLYTILQKGTFDSSGKRIVLKCRKRITRARNSLYNDRIRSYKTPLINKGLKSL